MSRDILGYLTNSDVTLQSRCISLHRDRPARKCMVVGPGSRDVTNGTFASSSGGLRMSQTPGLSRAFTLPGTLIILWDKSRTGEENKLNLVKKEKKRGGGWTFGTIVWAPQVELQHLETGLFCP